MKVVNISKLVLFATVLLNSTMLYAEEKVTVFAAASLTDAMNEIAKRYTDQNKVAVHKSFGSSGTLAKQIEKGAPADIFVSADTKWMHYLKEKKAINQASVVNLLGNKLVLVAPKGQSFKIEMRENFDFSHALIGKLCTGETSSVPIGIYAKQALEKMGWWADIQPRIVGTQDVRAALAFVERGECSAGIVYQTDANVSDRVEVIATFPPESHEPIVYPLGLVMQSSPQAKQFYVYLQSAQARQVFSKYGFTWLDQPR